jgi:hypothetical protein
MMDFFHVSRLLVDDHPHATSENERVRNYRLKSLSPSPSPLLALRYFPIHPYVRSGENSPLLRFCIAENKQRLFPWVTRSTTGSSFDRSSVLLRPSRARRPNGVSQNQGSRSREHRSAYMHMSTFICSRTQSETREITEEMLG